MNPDKWDVLLKSVQQAFTRENLDFAAEYVKMLKAFAPPAEHRRLLDIGVGEGPKEVEMLEAAGYSVTGITVQPWMLIGSPVKLMDMHDQEFRPDSFDAAYSTQVFEHSYAPWLLAMETWVTLRPSGKLFLSLPLPGQHVSVHHPSQLGKEEWKYLLEQAGFRIHSSRTEYIISEPVIIVLAEKSEPPDPHVKAALDGLRRIRGL
jgi:2-polyprenyl-3-methyl-5-hydroxy-6-metoxy-1,4-benzoquinol methylase